MGVVVSEITKDTMTATDMVTANSRNSLPMSPPIMSKGINTATSEILMETTVDDTSREPIIAASTAEAPCSRCREIFSNTTMASSTTKPVATVNAIRERLSRLYPQKYMATN